MAFCYATGNAGTGMCLQGAVEYGYEFVPVAGIINLFARMPRPPYGFVKVSVADGQPGSRSKQRKDSLQTSKTCILELWYFKTKQHSFTLQKFPYHISFFKYRQNL